MSVTKFTPAESHKQKATKNDALCIRDEESLLMLTTRALEAAKKAFNQVLEADGNDPAYWDIRFTAWMLDANFEQRLSKIEIEDEIRS